MLVPNPMSLTVHLCCLALLLFLNIMSWHSISCLGTQYQDCLSNKVTCGDVEFWYPFGNSGSGCGDPDLQLQSCGSQSHPLINIGGNEYHIMESSFYGDNGSMVIVNDNLWKDKCNLSGNYSQFWWSSSRFQVNNTYPILTLWQHCHQISENIYGNLSFCGHEWYYSLKEDVNLEGATSCNAYQLPINKNFSPLTFTTTILRQGFEVTWQVNPNRSLSCDACMESDGLCGYNNSEPGSTFLCYCPDGTSRPDNCPVNGDQTVSTILMIIVFSAVGLALIAIAVPLVTFYSKMRKQQPPPPRSSISKVEKFLREYAYEIPTRYSQSDLKKMTNNFAEKLGEGGFGVVYKGKLPNGALMAVKLLDRHRHSETQFMNEVATIGRIHHVNLVRLLGYCFESPISALLYEYMGNGSLEKFLFAVKKKGQILSWEQLYSIALGSARGIVYLHQDCEKRIIHFDIKPHNILLDPEFTPKVSDFGLAKLCGKGDDHISITAARGTPGYVAPEVCDKDVGPVTDKSDVYSFGMLLLEIVGGRKNFDWKASRSSQFYFPEWAFKLLERDELGMRLGGGREMKVEDEEKARILTKVGLWCIQYNYTDRPCMSRVVQMLEGNGDDVTSPPLPCNSSAEPEKPSGFTSSPEIRLETRLFNA